MGKFRSVSSWKASSDRVVLIQHADSFLTFFQVYFRSSNIISFSSSFMGWGGGGRGRELFSLQIQFTLQEKVLRLCGL